MLPTILQTGDIVQQFVKQFPRDGIDPCRLALLALGQPIVGDRIALVVGRRCRPQLPALGQCPPHGGMIDPNAADLQHVHHVAHVELILLQLLAIQDVADDRQHLGFGLAAVVVDDPPQGLRRQESRGEPQAALLAGRERASLQKEQQPRDFSLHPGKQLLVVVRQRRLEGEEGDTGNEFASGDKPDLNYPGLQNEILKAAYESGKPVVLVSLTGSAMDLSWADEHIPAIVQAWYPGSRGGEAVARLLFGECSPEGKLPVTFYRSVEELPEFTDYSMKGRTYRYMEQEALYPFGYGLSYTEFSLSEPEITVYEGDKVSETGIIRKGTAMQRTTSGVTLPDTYMEQLPE